MSRPVAGLACRIRVPVRQYQAVALVVRGNSNVVRLMHRDIGLSLDVEAFDSLVTAEEYRDRLAGFLDLPPVIVVRDARRGRAAGDREPRERRVAPGAGTAAALPDAPAWRQCGHDPQDRGPRDHRALLTAPPSVCDLEAQNRVGDEAGEDNPARG